MLGESVSENQARDSGLFFNRAPAVFEAAIQALKLQVKGALLNNATVKEKDIFQLLLQIGILAPTLFKEETLRKIRTISHLFSFEYLRDERVY